MHLVDGLAAPCMVSVHDIGARCWLCERGHGLFTLVCDVIIGGLLHEMDFVFWIPEPVMSLMGGCPMKWISDILHGGWVTIGGPCNDKPTIDRQTG